MAGSVLPERKKWSASRDKEGHRTYKVTFQVQTGSGDGPQTASKVAGLPVIGATWTQGNDSDLYALCTPELKIEPLYQNEIGYYWTIEYTFSTQPLKRCQDESIEDPLMEPPKVSGGFSKYTKNTEKDRNGNALLNSSGEQITGPNVEVDANRPTVRVAQNIASLGLDTFAAMVDTVNDSALWGLAARKVKLSNVSWERKVQGTCDYYYTRTLDFDVDFDTFDKPIRDMGTMALGKWNPETGAWDQTDLDGNDIGDYNKYQDKNGNIARVLLDGAGAPLADKANPVTSPNCNPMEYYPESNFTLLGIPTTF